jgi:hypothetical protein
MTLAANARDVLTKVNKVLSDDSVKLQDLTLTHLLTLAGVNEEEYYKALHYSKFGKSIVHQRESNALNINNYNKIILENWKANMDIQFVCDPYACISYIAAYVTKDERELSQMLKEAAKELRDADAKARLRKLAMFT